MKTETTQQMNIQWSDKVELTSITYDGAFVEAKFIRNGKAIEITMTPLNLLRSMVELKPFDESKQ